MSFRPRIFNVAKTVRFSGSSFGRNAHAFRYINTAMLAVIVFAAGCATPGDGPPPLLRAAAGQTRAGEEAYLSGRASDAVPSLSEAARLHLAAGDLPGGCRALLNLALAQRAAGDTAAATATATRLRELTPAAQQQAREQTGREGLTGELATATAWLDALLAVGRSDFAAAARLLGSADTKFPASSPWPGRLETLRAEVALGETRWLEARIHARAGVTACAAAGDRAEEARAWQLAGTAQLHLEEWTAARADFLEALKLEETLGGGARMAADLKQLALIADRLGDTSTAQLYAQRAAAITGAH
jgi:tetratricopeptide (TPR) repeat protein